MYFKDSWCQKERKKSSEFQQRVTDFLWIIFSTFCNVYGNHNGRINFISVFGKMYPELNKFLLKIHGQIKKSLCVFSVSICPHQRKKRQTMWHNEQANIKQTIWQSLTVPIDFAHEKTIWGLGHLLFLDAFSTFV